MSLDVDGTFLFDVLEPLTPDDTRPVSVQIAERICQAIEGGRFRQGQRLPTARHIGERYRTTAAVGYGALRRVVIHGYATAAPGKQGYYVRGVTPRQRPSQTSSEYVYASPHAGGDGAGSQRGEPAPARVRLSRGHSDPGREGVSRFPPPEDTGDPFPSHASGSSVRAELRTGAARFLPAGVNPARRPRPGDLAVSHCSDDPPSSTGEWPGHPYHCARAGGPMGDLANPRSPTVPGVVVLSG